MCFGDEGSSASLSAVQPPAPATPGPTSRTAKPKRRATTPSSGNDSDSKAVAPKRKRKSEGPTKAQLAKEATANKKRWKAQWEDWCTQHKWVRDPEYKQEVGWQVMTKSGATEAYRLQSHELETLPHYQFHNEHNPSTPGRSYRNAELLKLAYRKHATLAGLVDLGFELEQDPEVKDKMEREFLVKGKALFDECQQKLAAKAKPGSPRKKGPPIGTLFRPKSEAEKEAERRERSRPSGSWETPVWENGRVIGYWY